MDPDALLCPYCRGGTLKPAEGGLECAQCSRRFPNIGNIPCLVEDPGLWRELWLSRLQDYLSVTELRVGTLRQEAGAVGLLARTRNRVQRVAAALEEQRAAIDALFGPLRSLAGVAPREAIATRPEPGRQAAILECYENVFRDWVWGQPEKEPLLALLEPLVPRELGRVAVFGAGAGRLAVDVHQVFGPTRTFALDINPLPFLIADKLLSGETVALSEFPVDPNSDDEVVIPRRLTRPFPIREGFRLLFADALRPPFAHGSLDAVLTFWFIDAARTDLRETAAVINRALRQGGLWINLGPLRFGQTLVRSHTIEEVLEIVEERAFEVTSAGRADVPYFDSPVSGSRRNETIFDFVARKTGETDLAEVPDMLPPWVKDPRVPIPITPTLVSLGRTAVFTTAVLSAINGVRSTEDIANALGGSFGVDPAVFREQLRAFLAKLPAG
jgi:hypothetical protein